MKPIQPDLDSSATQGGPRFISIDLAPYANAGPHQAADGEWRWSERGPAVRQWPSGGGAALEGFLAGRQFFHGIPFNLVDPAGNNGRCWLALTDRAGSFVRRETVRLQKPQLAAGILVAHFTDLEQRNAKSGELLATYTIVFADGGRVHVPVRRRFEIAGRQGTIGTQGYAALPHTRYQPLHPSLEGQDLPVDSRARFTGITTAPAGSRQTYWLMALENPSPMKEIVAIELTAHHADLVLIAGITLSVDSANPLRRGPREGVIIDLAALADSKISEACPDDYGPDPGFVPLSGVAPGELALAIDLGAITQCSVLPRESTEEWLTASVKGWGAPVPKGPATAIYAQITAAQQAHLLLRKGNSLLRFRWQDILENRSPIKLAAHDWVRISVRVVDTADGKELPSRVHFRGEHGEYLPPLAHATFVDDAWGQNVGGDLRLGSMNYAYVPGRFEIMLPVGKIAAEIVHGFEYKVIRTALEIQKGQTELVFELDRWSDIRRRGWYCGDVHVHFLDPVTAGLESAAEDVNVTNLLAAQWGRAFTGVSHGIAREHDNGSRDRIVRIDSENRHHMMGDVFLLNLKEPVLPLSSGGAERDEIGGWEDVSLVDWCAACKMQGGLVFNQLTPTPHAEATAAIALGLIDAVEVRWFNFDFTAHLHIDGRWGKTPFDCPGVGQWYTYLNAGYRLPAVGGTDKMSNGTALGALRTYAFLGDGAQFDYARWCTAIAHGHTFVSTGPMLELCVEGKIPGEEIQLAEGGGQLRIRAEARSSQPFEVIDLVQNGQVIASAKAGADGLAASLDATVTIDHSSWLAARCFGSGRLHTQHPIDIGAHTSAVYVVVGNRRQGSTRDASELLTLLEGGAAYLEKLAVWRSDHQRRRHLARLDEGRQAILRDHPTARPNWMTAAGEKAGD
ncbi:CehA/McbA family metallohydrolase [Bradyrhizobium sp. USDA 4520]